LDKRSDQVADLGEDERSQAAAAKSRSKT